MPENILQEICDAFYNDKTEFHHGTITETIQRNICNYTLKGYLELDGLEYYFEINDGDWSGTEISQFELAENAITGKEEEPISILSFIPENPFLHISNPAIFQAYLSWRKSEWFKEKERNYNYDRFFQPGGQIEKYYRNWAAEKGMTVGVFNIKNYTINE